jgi:trk system potassium uptake protein TrkA
MAQKVARSLIAPNVLDYIPISDEYTICELAPPASFIGKTIGQLNLRAKYHIDVIAIKDSGQERIVMVPRAGSTIKEGDILVVIGKEQDVQNLR